MPTHYILIDFENVQPNNLHLVSEYDVKILTFRGASQKTIPFSFVNEMQKLGDKAQYIDCEGGKNAADFHICYYLGLLVRTDPDGAFNILSRDKGYDPMIAHLRAQKIKVFRKPDINDIPLFKVEESLSERALMEQIILVRKNLDGRGASRPRKTTTLRSTVLNLLKDVVSAEPDNVISALLKQGYIKVTDTKVTYPKGK